jgi:predicted secreted protein
MASEIRTQGTLLQLGSTTSPQTYTTVANVTGINGPDGQSPEIDVTNFSDTARRYLVGLPDNGSVSFDLNFASAESSNTAILGLYQSQAVRQWRIVFSNSDYLEFNGAVNAFPFAFAIDDVIKVSASIRVSGAVSFTNVP